VIMIVWPRAAAAATVAAFIHRFAANLTLGLCDIDEGLLYHTEMHDCHAYHNTQDQCGQIGYQQHYSTVVCQN